MIEKIEKIKAEVETGILPVDMALNMSCSIGYNSGYADRQKYWYDQRMSEMHRNMEKQIEDLQERSRLDEYKIRNLEYEKKELKSFIKKLTEKF